MAKIKKAQDGSETDANTTIEKGKLDRKYNTTYIAMKRDSIKESNKKILPKVYQQMRKETGKSPSSEALRKRVDAQNKRMVTYSKANKKNTKLDAKGRTDNAMKNFKNGGSLSGLTASNKRDKGIDPKGAFTKVQKKTLAGARGKASLTKDKQLGATKITAKSGAKMKKK